MDMRTDNLVKQENLSHAKSGASYMVRKRVFQLSREIEIPNKILVEKITELGIFIQNHLSPLEPDDVFRIKRAIKQERQDKVTEKRIRPSVIRRRAKKVAPPPVPEAPPVEEVPVVAVPVPETTQSDTQVTGPDQVTAEQTADGTAPQGTPRPVAIPAGQPPVQTTAKQAAVTLPKDGLPSATTFPDATTAAKTTTDEIDKLRGVPPKKKRTSKLARQREQLTRRELYEQQRERLMRPARMRKKKHGNKKATKATVITTPKAIKRIIRISESIQVGELAKRMGVKANEMILKLLQMGMRVSISSSLDLDTATLIATEFAHEVESIAFEEEKVLEEKDDKPEDLQPRPPVVTIMGHVDHGKTSLLDVIRHARVAEGEAGGITQHIGAYTISTPSGKIVFLDTPGHEAFTAMRARGTKVTDIVILVVAADDGVMPQTEEAINHARQAEVPLIVAINKIDKGNADPERVRQELTNINVVAEEWGGDTQFIKTSAKKKTGIAELLEAILLQAEILELKANPNKSARGVIIESKLEKGRGAVVTVLIQEGTLSIGDAIVCGPYFGRVRAIKDDLGKKRKKAGPAMPVEVVGLGGIPEAGDLIYVVQDEKQAKQIAGHRSLKQREADLTKSSKVSLEDLFKQIEKGQVEELKVIVKADVHGSAEAVAESISNLSGEKVKTEIIHRGVGGITERDVLLASASNAIIIGFNIRPEVKAQQLAEAEGVEIRLSGVIYELLDDIKKAMVGLLSPTLKESNLGRAEVRQTFNVPKLGIAAGSMVTDGKILRNSHARLIRDNVVVYKGRIGTLRRFKDDAREVATGYECGITLENYQDIKVGDIIEAYELIEQAATL